MDFRDYLNKLEDISADHEPMVGDIVEIELGDTLVETYIEDITEDGVVVKLDETALKFIIDARKELLESKQSVAEGWKEKVGAAALAGAVATSAGANTPKVPVDKAIQQATAVYNINKAVKKHKEKEAEKPKSDEKQVKEQGVAEADITRRGFLRGLGAAALGAAAGNALAGSNDPDFIRKVQDKHIAMTEKNPRYAKEHAALQLPVARGIVGNALEMNKRWAEKTAELLAKYGVTVNEGIAEDGIDEAKYQGREVPLNKPMAGDVKKSKVYVKKPNGKVVKVNFGDKKMRIKKSNPKRRKSFRARHRCENPGPKWKARYWSCRAW